jgi:hypothetical protein
MLLLLQMMLSITGNTDLLTQKSSHLSKRERRSLVKKMLSILKSSQTPTESTTEIAGKSQKSAAMISSAVLLHPLKHLLLEE